MPTVSNKTHRPLSLPLPGGKTLHLGPGQAGQISAKAVDSPSLKKLVEAGEIEVVDGDSRPAAGPGGSKKGRSFTQGPTSGGRFRPSGDR